MAIEAFGTAHLVALALCGVMLGATLIGARAAATRVLTYRAWTGFVLLMQVANIVYFALPQNAAWSRSLPLHVCDLGGLIASAALVWGVDAGGRERVRWPRTMVYYWGLGLTTQAFITPTVESGMETARFWLFWLTHLAIVGTAAYEVIVRGYRPTWRDFGVACVLTAAYGVAVIPLNIATGWNYGYAGNVEAAKGTLLDVLGPWPWRLAWMYLLGVGIFAVLTLVWGKRALRPA